MLLSVFYIIVFNCAYPKNAIIGHGFHSALYKRAIICIVINSTLKKNANKALLRFFFLIHYFNRINILIKQIEWTNVDIIGISNHILDSKFYIKETITLPIAHTGKLVLPAKNQNLYLPQVFRVKISQNIYYLYHHCVKLTLFPLNFF